MLGSKVRGGGLFKLFRRAHGVSIHSVSGRSLLSQIELLTFPIYLILVDHDDIWLVFSSIRLVQDHHIRLLLIACGSDCVRIDLSRMRHIAIDDASLG